MKRTLWRLVLCTVLFALLAGLAVSCGEGDEGDGDSGDNDEVDVYA